MPIKPPDPSEIPDREVEQITLLLGLQISMGHFDRAGRVYLSREWVTEMAHSAATGLAYPQPTETQLDEIQRRLRGMTSHDDDEIGAYYIAEAAVEVLLS